MKSRQDAGLQPNGIAPPGGRKRGWNRWRLVPWLLLAAGVGYGLRPMVQKQFPAGGANSVPHRIVPGHPGPWGDIGFVPITITAPDALLPVREFDTMPVRWVFAGFSRENLEAFFDRIKLPAHQRELLLAPEAFHLTPNGVEINPPCEVVLSLAPEARLEIYRQIAGADQSLSQMVFIPADSLEEHFHRYGVSRETVSLFKRLSCRHGNYLVFCSISCVLQSLPSYDEKAHFVKALLQQKTMLMKLNVTPKSDIAALADYWGRACWSTDVRALLQSLAAAPQGARLDVIELLPPLPTSLLYTYPLPQNAMNGPPVSQHCYWTAMNFFRDKPDPRFADLNFVAQTLKEDYYPVTTDPRFGDLVLLSKPGPNPMILHAAVYIADDVVFTKNGPAVLFPWTLLKLADLTDLYSFQLPPGQKLDVQYFRDKYH